MSGIVGLLNRDGRPVGQALLTRLTEAMAFRGPDARETWSSGNVGFGHGLLRTTYESTRERQPFSLDGETWITANVRLDGRADLVRELEGRGAGRLAEAPDAELILRAYLEWQEDCLGHVHGDFSFAVWDGRSRSLFCARDRLGVKPFFYALSDRFFVFSNTLNVVRMHPEVSDKLNDLAVADFLMFNNNQEPDTTTFADVRRLAPAHALTLCDSGLRIRRYWTFSPGEPIRYKRREDYVEHFRSILRMAVSDRLRTDRVGVMMSGGLDSPSVAAMAQKGLAGQNPAGRLEAYTTVFETLIPDDERHFAGLVAASLGIPIHYFHHDRYGLLERASEPDLWTPEPTLHPLNAIWFDLMKQALSQSRVLLSGQGGDILFLFPRNYVSDLLKQRRFAALAGGAMRIAWSRKRFPRITGRKLKRWLDRSAGTSGDDYPEWIDQGLETRLDLRRRWREGGSAPAPIEVERCDAIRLLSDPFWSRHFEESDPNTIPLPIDIRNPLFDLRLIEFTLGIPVVPWIYDKYLLREAMRGILPEPVRKRPKAPLWHDPVWALLELRGHDFAQKFRPVSQLADFVDKKVLDNIEFSKDNYWRDLKILSLKVWLYNINAVDLNFNKKDG